MFGKRVPFDLALQHRTRPQHAVSFPNVAFYDCLARDVLKHDGGKCEIELGIAEKRKVRAAVLVERHIRTAGQGCPGLAWATISALISTA